MSWGNYQPGKAGKAGKGGYSQQDMMAAYQYMQMLAMGKGGKGMGKGIGPNGKPYGIKQVMFQISNSGTLPGGRWENDDKTLVVVGLPEDTTDLDMYKIFAPFGAIASNGAAVMKDKEDKNKCTGVGFVNYLEMSSMKDAMRSLNGTIMPDGMSRLTVKPKGPPKEPKEAPV
eukprot:gnl/MRDRNA2_/MRDRNA2_98562_c0_seq1.p1 gnl/MRDRNA2_/MRDRNA2_98562_c0~~gnl/MRDRNA2_/MRDRNA2_98562_c0_seq1.p1  ORF type:complete len:172 (+),score=37.89 gnl/MRDRNA2_/MRDRNA2_98562_c0_seq1:79-594(+)